MGSVRLRFETISGDVITEIDQWIVELAEVESVVADDTQNFLLVDFHGFNGTANQILQAKNIGLAVVFETTVIHRVVCSALNAKVCEGLISLELGGAPSDLLEITYAEHILCHTESASSRTLRDDVTRESWIRACLYCAQVITPWTGLGSIPNTEKSRALPVAIEASFRPDYFVSRAIFFSLAGEIILGPGGYVGQDLDGFNEIMNRLASQSVKIRSTIHDPATSTNLSQNFLPHSNFFNEVVKILEVTGRVEMLG